MTARSPRRDAAAIERARVAQHAWITSLVEVASA